MRLAVSDNDIARGCLTRCLLVLKKLTTRIECCRKMKTRFSILRIWCLGSCICMVLRVPVEGQVIWKWANPLPTGNLLRGVCFLDSLRGILVGEHGTILRTTNAGAEWNAVSSNTRSELHDVKFPGSNTGFAIGANGTMLRTSDSGNTWLRMELGVTASLWSMCFVGSTGYCVGDSGLILYSTDVGVH